MSWKKRTIAVLFALSLLGGTASAIDLGDLIGVVGGGFLVENVAGPLDDFINTMTLNKGAKVQGKTKVVPIVSLGSGTRIGAVQVAGPKGTVRGVSDPANLISARARVETASAGNPCASRSARAALASSAMRSARPAS